MEYAIDKGIRVSNNSWGGGGYSEALYDVIEASQAIGHVFIASAGNISADIDVDPHYPASYDLPNIISVAATDNDDNLGTFQSGNTSNYGLVSVDLGAPGIKIYSTDMTTYRYLSGTSMAAPHVTGVVAQLMSWDPSMSWQQITYAVLSRTRAVDSLSGITVTGGVVDLRGALSDCNGNGIHDDEDIIGGTSEDCTGNGIPDECEPDCNGNQVADSCDIAGGTSEDCNDNEAPDECDLAEGTSPDCNSNATPDECDITQGASEDCNANGIPDDCIELEIDCNGNLVPDECDIAAGTSEDCTANGIPDECEPDCNDNQVADSCDIAAGTSPDCNGNGVPDECDITDPRWPDVDEDGVPDACTIPSLHVNANATGSNDGLSWANAFTELRDALGVAGSPPNLLSEIWVAAGTYVPASANADRKATFRLVEDVGVFGGFVGGETARGQRDPAANLTILSGDLNGDDEPGPLNNEENSHHVVTANGVDETAVLDGFTITGGHADDPVDTIHQHGAGMYNSSSSPTITNCVFHDNHASSYGGGMYILYGSSHPVLNSCMFINNSAYFGGGMSINAAGPTLSMCSFQGNLASVGGGLYVAPASDPTLINCTVSGNSVHGMRINSLGVMDTTVVNCIFWGNGAIERSQIDLNGEGMPTVTYSCIQGLDIFTGNGNIGDDPLFVDDEFHLSVDSPCIDAGDPAFVPDASATDLDGEPRVMRGRVDMGVDEVPFDCNGNGILDDWDIAEGTSEDCTLDVVPDECQAEPDCNGTDTADFNDICSALSNDCNGNQVPDECDLAQGTSQDCDGNLVPDECDIANCGGDSACDDCNGNGVPDGCDLDAGGSIDGNGNQVPDECEAHAPLPTSFPYSVKRNRYVSFSPNPETIVPAAFQIELTASRYFADSTGVLGWVGEPEENDIARVVGEPFYTDAWPGVVHVGACGLVPAATYEIRATVDGTGLTDALTVSTIAQPAPKYWGDVVGELEEGVWTGPNGVVNMDDVMAVVQGFKQPETAPHLTWVDVDPEVPDAVLNFTDILRMVQGFKGEPYPFSDPADCP